MTQPQDKFSEDLYATRDDAAPTTAAPATAPRTIPRFDPKAFLRRTFVEPPTSNEMPDADLPLFTAKPVATLATASDLIERCKQYMSEAEVAKVREAYRYADSAHLGQFRKSGEPYITHPIAVATILASWKLDAPTIQAGLMHDVLEDTPLSKQEMAERFGIQVAELVDGVSKLDKLRFASNEIAQAESFRKMLLAMARDVRVILVKLADRLHNMRTLGVMRPEKRARIGKETLDIYVPIAHRLGLNKVFRELQELSFANRYPFRYRVLYENILLRRNNRRAILEKILAETKEILPKFGIRARVIGRDKTIYGIYNKMRENHQSFSEALDIYGFRVIVRTKEDCYRTLGALHALYKPVHHRFKDFIAIPKTNGYQSLHTTVIGPSGTPIEYQIRTEEMHRVNEDGILTHWLYHQDAYSSDMQARTTAWLQSLLEIQRTSQDSTEFLDNIKVDLFPDRVYVFTPKGRIVSLPRGSSPIDFAYQIHTDVGNHAESAKINGEPRPLETTLQNGDIVEIVTNPNAGPSPAWLDYVHSGRARAEVRQFLRNCQFEDAVRLGRIALEEAAKENNVRLDEIPEHVWRSFTKKEVNADSLASLYANIGLGKELPATMLRRLVNFAQSNKGVETERELPPVQIKGNQGAAVQLSTCCHPIPGDKITGFTRPGHGLSVHRADCPHAQHGQTADAKRWMTVEWGETRPGAMFSVPIDIRVADLHTALAQITAAVAQSNSSIVGVSMSEEDDPDKLVRLTILVRDKGHLMHVMRTIGQRPVVIKVKRVLESGLPPKKKKA